VYNGTAMLPARRKNPPASQDLTDPIAHWLCGVSDGGMKGPKKRAPDWSMSEADNPKIRRR
jgi:hypothetical protein